MIEKSLFNIPYWKIQTIDFEEKKKELTKLLESYPEEKKGNKDFHSNRQSDRSGLSEKFLSIMNEEVETLANALKNGFAVTEVWSVSYDKDDQQLPHNHGTMGLSGILYLNLPKDAPITEYMQPWNDISNDYVLQRAIEIVEGDIIIVPSFILHFSRPNKSDSKKRIIGFDMKLLNDAGMIHATIPGANLKNLGKELVK